ncbi:MAG: hypothetical protein PHF63_00470 [Herbinix sp.]|nr:hypothetical protein [Herbinix sp.]
MISATRVNEIFLDCLFTEEELEKFDGQPTENDYIRVDGVTITVGFNPIRVEKYRDEISAIIGELDDGFKWGRYFDSLSFDKDGNLWGERKDAEELMMLGMAIGRIEYHLGKSVWQLFPGSVPPIRVIPEAETTMTDKEGEKEMMDYTTDTAANDNMEFNGAEPSDFIRCNNRDIQISNIYTIMLQGVVHEPDALNCVFERRGRECVPDYDDDGRRSGYEERDVRYNLETGIKSSWGDHMFMSIEDASNFVKLFDTLMHDEDGIMSFRVGTIALYSINKTILQIRLIKKCLTRLGIIDHFPAFNEFTYTTMTDEEFSDHAYLVTGKFIIYRTVMCLSPR